MAYKSFEQRLERLEALLKPRTVYAVLFADTGRVGLCDGSREKLTPDELRQRYPENVVRLVQTFAHEWMWDAL